MRKMKHRQNKVGFGAKGTSKLVGGGVLALLGAFFSWMSWMSIILAAWTFVALLVLNIATIISIGWWVLWTPMLMFFGGLLALVISLFIAFIGTAVASDA